MTPILPPLCRNQRRLLLRWTRKSKDARHCRRCLVIYHLANGMTPTEVAKVVCCDRSSVYRWAARVRHDGLDALRPLPAGRPPTTVNDTLVKCLDSLLGDLPHSFGYVRSRWSSELLAKVLGERFGIKVHPSTIRRLLPRIGWRYRRARPVLLRRDPRKAERLAAVEAALKLDGDEVEVFFSDEVDIHLNPKIGACWTRRGKQQTVPTPGKNKKRYIAGALNAHTGQIVWVDGGSKSSVLFIELLEALAAGHEGKRLVLIVDNYIIHKSKQTKKWLAAHPKVELVFQPTYSPWVNRIERLWKALHDTVTRNHRWSSIDALMDVVRRYLDAAAPFPGNGHALASLGW